MLNRVELGRVLDLGSPNTLRRWVVRADIDDGQRGGVSTATLEELSAPKAENRLRGTNEILRGHRYSSPGNSPPQPLIKAFIDALVEGSAVESVCAVLTSEGCQCAARAYCSWNQPDRQVAVTGPGATQS